MPPPHRSEREGARWEHLSQVDEWSVARRGRSGEPPCGGHRSRPDRPYFQSVFKAPACGSVRAGSRAWAHGRRGDGYLWQL